MAKNDDFDAIKRWYKQVFPYELAEGTVVTVDMRDALVKLNNSQTPQHCDYPNETSLSPGDEVMLFRSTRENSRWRVFNTYSRKGRVSNFNLQNGNSRNSPYALVQNGSFSATTVNSTSWITLGTITYAFRGGTPFIIYSGSASISGTDTLFAGFQVGAATPVATLYKQSASNNTISVNMSYMGTAKLYGEVSIKVVAACLSGGTSFGFTNYSFQVTEI